MAFAERVQMDSYKFAGAAVAALTGLSACAGGSTLPPVASSAGSGQPQAVQNTSQAKIAPQVVALGSKYVSPGGTISAQTLPGGDTSFTITSKDGSVKPMDCLLLAKRGGVHAADDCDDPGDDPPGATYTGGEDPDPGLGFDGYVVTASCPSGCIVTMPNGNQASIFPAPAVGFYIFPDGSVWYFNGTSWSQVTAPSPPQGAKADYIFQTATGELGVRG